VIVEAGIADGELTELARDIRKYHYAANALSVRILDSQRAATYDRHDDGGAFAEAHILGTVNKNTSLGIDRVEIRGKQID